jgi:HlyD family secretion protein
VTEIGYSAVRSPLQQGAPTTGQGQAIDYEIVITLADPPATLRSDLSVTADIITGRRDQALAIPIIALTVRERDSAEALPSESPEAQQAATALSSGAPNGNKIDVEGVFLVKAGKAVFVPVTVGIAGQGYFEVLSGLASGDSVVAGPYEAIRSLEEGKAVRAMDTARAKAAQQTARGGS